MAVDRETAVAALLADARCAFAGSGDFADLPTYTQVAERLALSPHIVLKVAAWREFAAWKRSLCPLCAVCGRRADTKIVRMCHTHFERWRRWGSPQPWQDWADACREDRLNTCDRCRKTFNGAQGRIKLCHDCDLQRRRDRALKTWYAKSDDEKREIALRAGELGRQRRRRKITMLRCAICEREFRGFPHRVFCGARCRRESETRQRREIRRRVKLFQLLQEQQNLMEILNGRDNDDRGE